MPSFQPIDSALLFSRQDPSDPRLGEATKSTSPEVVVLGYPDDEGIQLNGGRLGAASGPSEIRRWLYKTTPHARRKVRTFQDIGDLSKDGKLSERHEIARGEVAKHLKLKRRVLALGGGNDYAYSDGMALLDQGGAKPLIINVDAHLDVRDLSRGLSSGTPFFRLLESGVEFDFLELGIQAQCNARAHWDYVESKGGRILTAEEILASGQSLSAFVTDRCGDWLLRARPTYLAIDMDAFAWPYAAGTSAAWPLGLQPESFWALLQMLLHRLDVRVLGLYEVSPPLDNGGGTARLAAQWAHCFLHDV